LRPILSNSLPFSTLFILYIFQKEKKSVAWQS